MKSLTAFLICLLFTHVYSGAQTVSTVAGMAGVVGSANGPAATSSFNNPYGIACDPSGNIYVANRFGHTIRKITPSGTVSVFAGSGGIGATDGQGTAATFNEPWAVACDTLGNVYVADTKNYKIRKISSTGLVTTVAGTGTFGVTNGATNIAQFGFPAGIAVNKAGTVIYVADRMTHTIRQISGGNVTTLAGVVYSPGAVDGPGASAKFDHPNGIALDVTGYVLVADEYNNKIRAVSPSGVVSTLTGSGIVGSLNGPAASASYNSPWGLCVLPNGDIFIGDANNFTIRKLSGGNVTLYAGQDGTPGTVNGPALQATFNGVSALCYNSIDNAVYLCDPYSQLVRKVISQTTAVLTLASTSGNTSFCSGSAIAFTASPGNLSNYILKEGATILGTSVTGVFNITGLATGPHTLTCTALDLSGITITSNTLNISITSSLSVSIVPGGSTSICSGDSVTLGSSVSGTYLWSNGATTPTITVGSAATYTLTVTNSQGCSGQSAPVSITTLQPPAATITSASSAPACQGDSILLTAGNATTFQWSNGAVSQSTYATAPGIFTVMVTNGAGCSAISLPMSVNYYPATTSTISPSGNILLPQGSSVTLSANAGTGFLWSTGAVTQTITVNTQGTFTVTVTDPNGCSSTPATSQVSFITSANMITLNGPATFCEGDSVVLTSVFPTGNQWYHNGSLIPGATLQNYTAVTSGYYKVRNTPPSGTSVFSDSTLITVNVVPNNVSTTSDTVCKGSSAILTAAPQSGISYNWYSTSSGGTSLATGLSFTTPALQQNKSFYVELSNSFGCVRSNRFEVIAMLLPQPAAAFTATQPAQITNGFEVLFYNASTSATTYFWDFGDPSSADNNSAIANPSHVYAETGDYIIRLIATTDQGCVDTSFKVVSVMLADNIFIPSGFTPNNDGNNDYFRVRGNNIAQSDISIFNQWGQRIWFSEKETTGWDGTSKGQTVDNGAYAYAIEITFTSGKKQFFRGNINVIR